MNYQNFNILFGMFHYLKAKKRVLAFFFIICICKTANAQSDSLINYINMSFEELLNIKLTSGSKNEQKVKDIPASVVVINRTDIELHGYKTLTEIIENIPGMYKTNDYSVGAANFGVRGFWSVLPNNNLMIFVNDVDQISLPYSSYLLDQITVPVEAIERIEVIRGPMSVLYGSGAFFGVINIFTKKINPEKSLLNVVTSSLGTQNTRNAMVRVANTQNNFSYSLNASVNSTSGINQPYSKMNSNTSIFNTSTTKDLLSYSSLYFGFNANLKNFYTDFSYNESNSGIMFLFPSAGNGSSYKPKSTKISFGYKNSIFEKWTLDGKITYYNQFIKAKYDAIYSDSYEYQDLPSNGLDADFTLNSDITTKLHLTVGANYKSILNVENNLHLPTNGFGIFYNTTQTIDDKSSIDSWAGFTQLNYQPFDKLNIITGCRLEQRLDFTLKTIIADTLFGVPANIIKEKYSQHDIQFIPRLAAIYYINNTNILKFMYGKAINTPSWFQVINGGAHNLDLHSQFIQSFELNYITTPTSKLIVNTSLFFNKMKDLIVRTLGVDNEGKFYNYNSNVGKVETKGLELTLQLKPFETMDIEASCTYQKSIDLDNKNLTYNYSPNFLGNLKVSYQFSSKINASLITNYIDKMETTWIANPDGTGNRIGNAVPSYYTISANLRAADILTPGFFIEIHGTNLFNQDVLFPATTNNNGIFPKGTLDMGRQIIFSLGYNFN